MANEYAEETSKKIMKASDVELEEISEDIEMEVYEQLTPEAKARLSVYMLEWI